MNANGLPRTIPAEVKRSVRQRCGFGCVLCGASIYEYDHFDPPFANAKEHDPSGITLLCPTHHAEKTRGILPLQRLREFNEYPAARRDGQTAVTRPYFEYIPSLAFGGGMLVENTPIPMMVNGEPLIEFMEPEEDSRVTRINAVITDENGRNLLRIIKNEWIVETGVWDYEWVGQRMTIRDSAAAISLQITVNPPELIEINRLRFRKDGFDVLITQTEMRVNSNRFIDCVGSNCRVGMSFNSR